MASVDYNGVDMTSIYNSHGPWGFEIPPIKPGKYHKIMFEFPVDLLIPPKPHYNKKSEYTEGDFVRLPYLNSRTTPTKQPDQTSKYNWEIIQEALLQPIKSTTKLESIIKLYHGSAPRLNALHHLFDNAFSEDESNHFFEEILPGIVRLALSLPEILPGNLPLLKSGSSKSISLSQKQIASLLANAFLCTFPYSYNRYENVNFVRLFAASSSSRPDSAVLEKLKCIIHYFKRVLHKMPVGVVTFERKHIYKNQFPRWDLATEKLSQTRLHVNSEGTIEDNGLGLLQVDFANKVIGGGVLGHGCVQEEIRFVICPELIISRLFTEELKDNEAVLITGVERFSKYSGYADTFVWAGDYRDKTPFDNSGRRQTSIIAIDAIRFHHTRDQFKPGSIRRELNKAYVGFQSRHKSTLPGVATGNWGCGAFRGDPNLKWLIQLMSCTLASRDLIYYTFDDDELQERIIDMYNFIATQNITVSQLWRYLCRFEAADLPTTKFIAFLQQAHMDTKSQPSMKHFVTNNRTTKHKKEDDDVVVASTSSEGKTATSPPTNGNRRQQSPIRNKREKLNEEEQPILEVMDVDLIEIRPSGHGKKPGSRPGTSNSRETGERTCGAARIDLRNVGQQRDRDADLVDMGRSPDRGLERLTAERRVSGHVEQRGSTSGTSDSRETEEFENDEKMEEIGDNSSCKRKHVADTTPIVKDAVLNIINILNGDKNENKRPVDSLSSVSFISSIDSFSKKHKEDCSISNNLKNPLDTDVNEHILVETLPVSNKKTEASWVSNNSSPKKKITDYFTKLEKTK